MRVALVSLNQHWLNKDINFARCVEFVQQARQLKCELIIFPEMTLTGYSLDVSQIAENEKSSNTLKRFSELAYQEGINIIFGACLIDGISHRPANHFCLALKTGESSAIYKKIHPFSFTGEDDIFAAGNYLKVSKLGTMNFVPTICYDLRFPELYAVMSSYCNAAIVIANWPSQRISHWRTLLTARAIENQFYMFGVNRTGMDGNQLLYEKSSFAINPDGNILEGESYSNEFDVYKFDSEIAMSCRDNFPTVRDKRYSLYKYFLEEMHVK